jgi:immunoglobulin-like protein involved in spore germination
MTEQQAALAVQQLVYTAQDAAGSKLPVTFLVSGERTDTLLGEPTDKPVAPAVADDTLSAVQVGAPADGATVQSPFTVTGQVVAFEGNVQWELKSGDRVVKSGFATARECCTLSPYSFTVTAPAGSYTLVVHDEDVSDGEGVPATQDTKQVVVE